MHRKTMKKLALAALAPLFSVSVASAATLYSETNTASLTPANGGFIPGATTTPGITTKIMDNVIVPGVINGLGGLNITRVTMQVDQKGTSVGAPTGVGLYYSTLNGNGVNTPTINAPQFVANSAVLPPTATAGDHFNNVTWGDGINTLFSLSDAQLNYLDQPGSAEFALGYQLPVNGDATQGVRLAFPDGGFTQTTEYFEYDSATNTQNAWTFFSQISPNDGSGLWITVEGSVVPEPASMGLAALGGLMLLARRPGRQS